MRLQFHIITPKAVSVCAYIYIYIYKSFSTQGGQWNIQNSNLYITTHDP